MSRNDEIIKAVRSVMDKGVTGIKFELEAQMNRNRAVIPQEDGERIACTACGTTGNVHCDDCNNEVDGHYNGYVYCEWCEEGRVDCAECEGTGEVAIGESEEMTGCEDCSGSGRTYCRECDGDYRSDCDNYAYYEDEEQEYEEECGDTCQVCQGDGYVTSQAENGFSASERGCQKFIMQELKQYGLADDDLKPTGALKYLRFYNDGSVDSECTFTIWLRDPSDVFQALHVFEVWNKLGAKFKEYTGTDMDTRSEATYPSGFTSEQWDMARNFKESMNSLMPALYFLASANDFSRGLRYRNPGVGIDDKYYAIAVRHGAVEFRVFDTCYDNIEQALDNVVVMANCMKLWSATPVKTPVQRKFSGMTYRFGVDSGNDLKRLYQTNTHIDLLNVGLQFIKPNYMKVRELKRMRKFNITKRTIADIPKRIAKEAELEYNEYEARQTIVKEARRLQYMSNYFEERSHDNISLDALRQQAEVLALDRVERWARDYFLNRAEYIENRIRERTQSRDGDWSFQIN
jgi:hypothetical protein